MATKKTVITQVGSALGAAAARVESLKPKHSSATKHSKAKAPVIAEPVPAPSASTPAPQLSAPQLSEREEIELTAYIYAQSRGFQGGSPDEDWVRAEREVHQRRTPQA